MLSPVLADLDARGLLYDSTDRAALDARLSAGPVTLYCGFDPTADSLHVGNLVPLLLLRRFQLHGHRPLALAGGATGMVGDPGGRSSERNLLDAATLEANTAAISAQLERFLDFEPGPAQARLVDNRTWTEPMGVIEFLRDVGKHMTVQQMLGRDAIRNRLDRESGLSYTEFSYMLLQANDYYVLHRDLGCELQVAGSDQWGNIVSGVDMIRRRADATVHALVSPLVTRSDGQKFGKSVDGALWLDRRRTSPFQLYQYFLNVADGDVGRFLLQLTLTPVEECRAIAEEHEAAPHLRAGQRRLAREMVSLVHGAGEVPAIEQAAAVVFGGAAAGELDDEAYALLEAELTVLRTSRSRFDEPVEVASLLVESGLAPSKGEVRRNAGGFSADGVTVGERPQVAAADLARNRYLLLRRGRKGIALVVADPG